MIYDFRPEAEPEHACNAQRAIRGRCWLNGTLLDGVCYADTEAGVVCVHARNMAGRCYLDHENQIAIHCWRGAVVVSEDGALPTSFEAPGRTARAYDLAES